MPLDVDGGDDVGVSEGLGKGGFDGLVSDEPGGEVEVYFLIPGVLPEEMGCGCLGRLRRDLGVAHREGDGLGLQNGAGIGGGMEGIGIT